MMDRRLLVGLLAVLPLFLGAGGAMAQAPATTRPMASLPYGDGDYRIIADAPGQLTNMCVDVPGWDTRPNIFVQLYPEQAGFPGNQYWHFQRQADGHYQITNVNSGLALDVPNGSMSPGVHVQQYYPHTGDNQRWRLDATEAWLGNLQTQTIYRIVNKRSQLNLDVPNGIYSLHQYIQQWTPHTGWNQTWLLLKKGQALL
jgi:hypothetical protein